MKSLRSTLATSLLGLGLLLVGASLAATYWLAGGILARQFDRGLRERASGLATLLEQTGERVELHFADELLPAYVAGDAPEYFQVWIGERTLERSVSLHLAEPPAELPPLGAGGEELRALELPDGRAGRALGIVTPVHHYRADPVTGADPGAASARVVVAIASTELDRARRSLLLGVLGVALVLALSALWLGRRALLRSLRPLERWTSALEELDARQEPTQALAGLPSELVPVAERIQALTASLQAALERERRTTASIAHELRTPIAELRALADVALQTPGDAAGAQETIRECRDIALDMQALVTTLLSIARSRAAGAELARQTVDVGELLATQWSSWTSRARERRLECRLEVEPNVPAVAVNEEALGTILSNLLDNAGSHAPPDSRIDCRVEEAGRHVRVVVENRLADPASADLARFGEPFWRADAARSRRDHFGLGLALARECAAAAAIELSFRIEDGLLRVTAAIAREDPLQRPSEP